MAVPSSQDALTGLQKVISDQRVPYTTLLHDPYLPDGYQPVDPTADAHAWLWSDPPPGLVGGYGNPDTYRLPGADPLVWESVAVASATGTAEARESYRRHSVDLTMRGGTTSGVVYPLAVCEVASHFRVRNVGGASAGAIGAACTAAAELGRSAQLPDSAYELSPADRAAGKVRPGFAGLADTLTWLAQVTPDGVTSKGDQYRLAQLFRPAPGDRKVYAVAIAFMRRQLWAIPLTALAAFGWLSKLLIALLVAGGVLATAAVGARIPSWPAIDRPAPTSLAWAPLDLVIFFAAVGALLVLLPGVTGRGETDPPPWLAALVRVSSRYRQPDRTSALLGRLAVSGLVFGGAVAAAALGWWHWTAGALVGAALSALLTAVVGSSIWRYVTQAAGRDFGLLGGAATRTRRRLTELLAGAARPTVDLALVPWLDQTLTRLAALDDGRVLRFGHLWEGRGFTPAPRRPADPAADDSAWRTATADLRARAADPRQRLVNLELITTDLSRQRPYRFPLAWDDEQIYLCHDDLRAAGVFGDDVLAAMADPEAKAYALHDDDTQTRVLHRLPDPWNLPVIFAVRLSLSLPGLFKAVRVYRLVSGTTIRDDLGRAIRHDGQTLTWPPEGSPPRAEPLWFSDGGITSNFPVNLFDVPLPSWPTFGLNLAEHPYDFPHQDVWLPQDWQASIAPATTVPGSLVGFVSTILDTARNWRDTMQTGLPGYRSRIAWVRQRPDEGGTNLFMPREIIASLALRGALAGARLTRRFGDPAQEDRYRWLRLRVALGSLSDLRTETGHGLPAYADILSRGPDFVAAQKPHYPFDPYSAGIDWYEPADPGFWAAAKKLLDDVSGPGGPDGGLTEGVPSPHPDLKQVPPV